MNKIGIKNRKQIASTIFEFIKDDKKLWWYYGYNNDLYWTLYKNNNDLEAVFELTSDDSPVYELFKSIYDDLSSGIVYVDPVSLMLNKDINSNPETLVAIKNFQENEFTYYSDETTEFKGDSIKIEKQPNKIKLIFIRREETWGMPTIRFRVGGSVTDCIHNRFQYAFSEAENIKNWNQTTLMKYDEFNPILTKVKK